MPVRAAPPAGLPVVTAVANLIRCHDRELHARFGKRLRRVVVDGRFRTPEAPCLATETDAKVVQPPEDFPLPFVR